MDQKVFREMVAFGLNLKVGFREKEKHFLCAKEKLLCANQTRQRRRGEKEPNTLVGQNE